MNFLYWGYASFPVVLCGAKVLGVLPGSPLVRVSGMCEGAELGEWLLKDRQRSWSERTVGEMGSDKCHNAKGAFH